MINLKQHGPLVATAAVECHRGSVPLYIDCHWRCVDPDAERK